MVASRAVRWVAVTVEPTAAHWAEMWAEMKAESTAGPKVVP